MTQDSASFPTSADPVDSPSPATVVVSRVSTRVPNAATLLLVGKITRPHGILGELKAQVPAGYLPIFDNLKRIFLRSPRGELQSYKIRGFRVHQGSALLKLIKIVTRNDAELLRDHEVLIEASDLPQLPTGEYYTHQLVGLLVQRINGEPLGRLADVLATGSNDVYIIDKPDGKELLLPVIASVVRQIDLTARLITVVVPEGLE